MSGPYLTDVHPGAGVPEPRESELGDWALARKSVRGYSGAGGAHAVHFRGRQPACGDS